MHTTNYYNTFIQVSEDCKNDHGVTPPVKVDKKTVANLQYDILASKPYAFTSDEVLFEVFAVRKGFSKSEFKLEKQKYFSKGQPCFRASPLTKTYGWGVHSNAEGKLAIYGVDTEKYEKLTSDKSIKQVKAMRNKRK